MKIRIKITLVVLPVILFFLLLMGSSSYFSASRGIGRITEELLSFKVSEVKKYADSQWIQLLNEGFSERPEMVEAAKASVAQFARSIIRTETENIFFISAAGEIVMSTSELELLDGESENIISIFKDEDRHSIVNFEAGGVRRVAHGFLFAPFDGYYIITETYDTFYQDIEQITLQIIIFSIASCVVSAVLLYLLSSTLTRPLDKVVSTMKHIIVSGDLNTRVPVEYDDETGQLAQTFNLMSEGLASAQKQIKTFALKAVLAQKNEAKIRNIFQKYVPQDLIDQFFERPEAMLQGNNRKLVVLFSDIRSFTTISEKMEPDELVQSLNDYFSVMVDLILDHNGIVDKYIGDAIMAFYGAPIAREDDPIQSVRSSLAMIKSLDKFNKDQISKGRPEFHIGIGVNYGVVTVGNIGTEKKMDYTVIGDTVNLASRLEGLTKNYKQQLVISEFLYEEIKNDFPTKFLDVVAVKGKKEGVKIYTVAEELTDNEKKIWQMHNKVMDLYLRQRFTDALRIIKQIHDIDPNDFNSLEMKERCIDYMSDPPGDDWNGTVIMKSK